MAPAEIVVTPEMIEACDEEGLLADYGFPLSFDRNAELSKIYRAMETARRKSLGADGAMAIDPDDLIQALQDPRVRALLAAFHQDRIDRGCRPPPLSSFGRQIYNPRK